jgi:leucyl aminopeptidase
MSRRAVHDEVMNLRFDVATTVPTDADAVGRLVYEDSGPNGDEGLPGAEQLGRRGFTGKLGQTAILDGENGLVVLAGLGSGENGIDGRLRRAAASFARAVSGCSRAALELPGFDHADPARAAQVVTEGLAGATYRFGGYRSGDESDPLESVTLVVAEGSEDSARVGLERGAAIGEAVALARDLGNTPAGALTPSRLAEIALEVAEQKGLEATIFDEDRIKTERLGGLLGVARGSAEPPRLIELRYDPEPGAELPTVALVGKGITFDSGGLSLKTGEGMMTMKTDMSGAAAVIAAMSACKALGVRVRVLGIAPATENMPGGRATKPGDVLVTRNGKTIEVLNTDAEGRLILSDGLSLAAEEEPDAIIDLATLTGACVVALGRKVAGVMGNDSRLVQAVMAAGRAAGEGFWALPLPEAYRSDIESEVADMKNIGKPGNAGALVAGLLLKEFVADRPWVHLDIAGPSRSEEESYELRKGSTGFGVRTLCELLSGYDPIGGPADERADEAMA